MTRKQALWRALNILARQEQTEEIQEIQNKLNELIEELPITSWTKETVLDTFDQFAIDRGRNATTTDLKIRGLPPHPVIKHRFGMTAKTFLRTYYPSKCDSKIYNHKTREEWLAFFINEYERIKPSSAEEYNRERQAGAPAWQTVAKLYDITKWVEFQAHCVLPVYRKKRTAKSLVCSNLLITRHSDLDEAYQAIVKKIKKAPKAT